ncbi:helix-turn-helix domain-containing protein [Nitrosomonas marina]|uniref:helix-turn-helix domain-containing protein n=1 Tax=Nitrosomonas marina TaxID=917 RepID=UPI00115F9BF8|nr:helix-turn-helix domain-containing protein [Nitrosomonas marina]
MSDTNNPDKMIGIKKASEILDIHIATIRRMARDGEIPAFKVGREWRFYLIDLSNHFRQQYKKNDGEKVDTQCHSTNARIQRSGGSKSQSQAANRYADLLGLKTKTKPKNSTTH